ncbi:MAG: hypothetical protein M3P33_03485, partial [bacterium]|nr:hypothetical protein [bacterium]
MKAAESKRASDTITAIELAQVDALMAKREAGLVSGTEEFEQTFRSAIELHRIEDNKKIQLILESASLATRLAAESYLDTKTELYTAVATADICGKYLVEWINSDDTESSSEQPESLRKIKIIMTDMMLFHFGNQSLGPDGFDKRIELLTQGQIAMSRFLADDEQDLYPPFKPSEMENDVGMKTYFDSGSEARVLLEGLKGKLKVSMVRLNAGGGDEFMYLLEESNEASDADSENAIKAIDHVIKSTTLMPGMDILHPGEIGPLSKPEIDRRFDYINRLSNYANNLHLTASDEVHPKTSETLNRFPDFLRSYLKESERFASEINRPDIDVVMGYAETRLDNG